MIYFKKKSRIKRVANFIFKKREFSFLKYSVFVKSVLTVILSLFLLLYVSYLFFLPAFLNEENAELFLNNYLSKNTKLILDIDNLKVRPNYKFDINVKADSLKLKYTKNSDFVALSDFDADINIISLIFGYIDIAKIKSSKFLVNVSFTKDNRYSCFDYFDLKILELNSKKSKFKLRNLNFYTDKFVFELYDENIREKFFINSEKLKISMLPAFDFKNRSYEISTKGVLKASDSKISDFNLKLNFKTKNDVIGRFNDILLKLNRNPLVYAREYGFYSRVGINLKINPSEKKFNIEGNVDLSDFSFCVNNMRLPKNSMRFVFKGDKAYSDCDFNFIKNQFIRIKSKMNMSKNKFIELTLNSNDINLADFKDILSVFYKILNVKFSSNEINLEGFASADLYLKSDFKTINSSGKFEIRNASVHHKKTGLTLKNINSNINLQNNKINIKDTSAFVDKSKFYLSGVIDEKTNLNLKVNSDTIDVANVINLIKSLPLISSFIPSLDDYVFKSGFVNIMADIKGSLKNPIINMNSRLENIRIYVKSLKTEIYSKNISIKASPDKNSIKDVFVIVSDSNIRYMKNNFYIKNIKMKLNESNVIIEKTAVNIDNIKGYLEGEIRNYKQKNYNAIIKISALIPSNNKYIVIKSQSNVAPKLNLELNVFKDKILINNSSIVLKDKKPIIISGSILNYTSQYPTLNAVKITSQDKIAFYLPQNLIGFDFLGSIVLNGRLDSPQIDGNINLYNVVSREYNLNIGDLLLNIKNSSAYINIVHGRIFGFDFDLVAQAKLLKDKLMVDFAQFNSTYINIDALNKYLKDNGNINIEVANFKGNIAVLEVMDMLLNSVYIEGSYKDNNIIADKFRADLFSGNVFGSFTYGIYSNKTNADIILKEINVRLLSNGIKEIKDLSIAATGRLSALIKADFSGFDFNTLLKTFDGYIKFNIDDGELSQFAKLERFLQAGNILSQSILKLTLNSTVSAITNQNTGDFKTIEGTVKIKNSNADVQYIKTQGSNMSLYMTGNFNLLTQNCNMNIYGRIPSSMVNILGPIGKFSTEQIVDKMSDDAKSIIKSITVSPLEKLLSDEIPEEYISKIPPLAYGVNVPVREFKVRIIGDPKNISSVRFFKWRKN